MAFAANNVDDEDNDDHANEKAANDPTNNRADSGRACDKQSTLHSRTIILLDAAVTAIA
jgi:hypothetical protein